MSAVVTPTKRRIGVSIDGLEVQVPEGTTILQACRRQGTDPPPLCYIDTLHPVNVCRVCVVEVEGSRTLVPACSRPVEAGMKIKTGSERVQHSRRMVLEFLASSADMSLTAPEVKRWMKEYNVRPERY